MGMGSAQAINAAWLTSKMSDYKRPVALAAYVMSIQLAGFPGNQLFQTKGKQCPREFKQSHANPVTEAPRYRHGLIIAASCAIAAAVVILVLKLLYRIFDNGEKGVEVTQGVVEADRRGEDVV